VHDPHVSNDDLTLPDLVHEYNMTFKSTTQGQNTFDGVWRLGAFEYSETCL